MVTAAWRALAAEIQRWADMGRPVEFWWRDDDACRPTPSLSLLYALAVRTGVPLALAAVPESAEREVFEDLPHSARVIQHGTDHLNRAETGGKKTEFSPLEPPQTAIRRLVAARDTLDRLLDGRLLPVLAPPWNRVPPMLIPRLKEAGYCGYSTFGVRKVTNGAGDFVQVNTHVDIIDWKGTRGFCGEDIALHQATRHLSARRTAEADGTEPTGWLSHHAVHDDASWAFLERVFDRTRTMEGVVWRSPSTLFPLNSAR